MTVLNQIYQNQLQKEVTINENFSATSIAGIFADRGNHNGLNFNYYGGRYQKQDGTQGTIANGSIALTDNATNYVYFNLQDEIIQVSTTSIPLNCFPIAKLTTSSGVITAIEDLRVIALYANGTPTNLSYTLPIATTTSLGGIKVDGLTCYTDVNGVLKIAGTEPVLIKKTTAIQSSNVTTNTNITELSNILLEKNAVYEVDCFIIFQTVSTSTGIKIGFETTTGTVVTAHLQIPTTSSTTTTPSNALFPQGTLTNSGSFTTTGVSSANSNLTARFNGLISVGSTDSVLNMIFASEVNGSNVTIQIGSILKLEKIA